MILGPAGTVVTISGQNLLDAAGRRDRKRNPVARFPAHRDCRVEIVRFPRCLAARKPAKVAYVASFVRIGVGERRNIRVIILLQEKAERLKIRTSTGESWEEVSLKTKSESDLAECAEQFVP